jgi:hypothetical protein
MRRLFLYFCMLAILLPVSITGTDTGNVNVGDKPQTMNGSFWNVLETRSPLDSSLLYTSGFVSGYEYALNILHGVAKSRDYSGEDMLEFIDMLKFPSDYTNSQIKDLVDRFYADEKNRFIPLFVAFTYARQVLNGYPAEYSRSYLEDMRKQYAY